MVFLGLISFRRRIVNKVEVGEIMCRRRSVSLGRTSIDGGLWECYKLGRNGVQDGKTLTGLRKM